MHFADRLKRAIEEKLAPVFGVEAVGVDIDGKSVTVTGGDHSDLVAAINAAGYDIV